MQRAAVAPVAVFVLLLSTVVFLEQFGRRTKSPMVQQFKETARFYRSINSYGLFADMTTRRPEIVIQGSRDGRTWQRARTH